MGQPVLRNGKVSLFNSEPGGLSTALAAMQRVCALVGLLAGIFGLLTNATAQVPRRATATATVKNGIVTSITIGDKGLDYDWTPSVTITGGGGTGAVARAFLTQWNILDRIEILAEGIGYTNPPLIEVGPPTQSHNSRTAIAAAVVKDGAVTVIRIADAGLGYFEDSPPLVQLISSDGTGAVAVARVASSDGGLDSIKVRDGGSGYMTAPQVVIESPDAVEARKEADDRQRREAEAQAQEEVRAKAKAQAELKAQAKAEAQAKAKAKAEAEMRATAERAKLRRIVGISSLATLSAWALWLFRGKLKAGFQCRRCGGRYAIWTAQLGAGMCNDCCEAQRAATAEADAKIQEAEAAKQRAKSAATQSPELAKENALFYYKVKGQENGPFTFKQLTSMWESGHITADGLYRQSDCSEWFPLIQRLAERQSLNKQATGAVFAGDQQFTVQGGSAYAKVWLKAAIFLGCLLLAICGFAFLQSPRVGSKSDGGAVITHSAKKSARRLIRDYAESLYGRNADIEIQSGFYGGTYQVIVRVPIASGIYGGGYDRSSYTVAVDETAQRIDSWQLYEHN